VWLAKLAGHGGETVLIIAPEGVAKLEKLDCPDPEPYVPERSLGELAEAVRLATGRIDRARCETEYGDDFEAEVAGVEQRLRTALQQANEVLGGGE